MHNASRPSFAVAGCFFHVEYHTAGSLAVQNPRDSWTFRKSATSEGSVGALDLHRPTQDGAQRPTRSLPNVKRSGSRPVRTTSGRLHAPSPPTWTGQSAVPPPRKVGLYSPPLRLCITLELASIAYSWSSRRSPQYASTTKDDGCASSLLALLPHPATRTARCRRCCARSID
ncbi:hypothetical protein OH76DRAFT_1021729 [Lentinus brumalis]|uniref:Uncharacterized protein n=1 Tax=Lentinus brumalis TaxID=2498619 RepID=A0A371CXU4_9APHY|nr:hypothetical protein OH76DRAFT_1021729 [Polyporus brumalis]